MCYAIKVRTNMAELGKRFRAIVDNPDALAFADEVSGFSFGTVPVISNEDPGIIATDFHWGLIPHWSADLSIRKQTLNARIETLKEKPSFRDAVSNRCLIIATGFHEWRWLDEKGRRKQKYEIVSAETGIFTFAGIYSRWTNPENNQLLKSFSIVTTQAGSQMSFIHNTKKRMPVVLRPEDEMNWLDSRIDVNNFSFPQYEAPLIAFAV